MASFVFAARDPSGQPQAGVIEAATAGMVVSQLRERGWLVLNIQYQADQPATAQARTWLNGLLRPRNVHVELSIRQLAAMLHGGISLLAAMQTIAEQSESLAIRNAYERLIDRIQQGQAFSDALESQPGFPHFLVRLVRVGERTGIQETVLLRGADMMRTRRETVREILTALTYPLLVLMSAIGATTYMVTMLIPKLAQLLQSLGKPLPPMTQSLVTVSRFFDTWMMTILFGMGVAIITFIISYMSPSGRLLIDRAMLRIPIVGKIFRLSATLTFSQTLGTLVRSGVTVLDALVTVQQMHKNRFFAQIAQQSRDAIIRGNNLADTLRVRQAYMPLLASMTAVGEESGNLDEVMDEVTQFHTWQLQALIKTLGAWVTPAITLVVGSIVGYIYIAFFLGIFSIAK